MNIVLDETGWGEVNAADIKTLLADAASHINGVLKSPLTDTFRVHPAPPGGEPMVFFRSAVDEAFRIQLTARGRYWSQYAFQFAHEFCHVLSGYETLRHNPNNWFHEAICEIASLFTLRAMASTWPTRAPYPHWADYAASLAAYAQERLTRPGAQLPAGVSLTDWLSSREAELRKYPYHRDKNSIIAHALLPVFEGCSDGWNACRKLPDATGCLSDYLHEWHETAEPNYKDFVSKIAARIYVE